MFSFQLVNQKKFSRVRSVDGRYAKCLLSTFKYSIYIVYIKKKNGTQTFEHKTHLYATYAKTVGNKTDGGKTGSMART